MSVGHQRKAADVPLYKYVGAVPRDTGVCKHVAYRTSRVISMRYARCEGFTRLSSSSARPIETSSSLERSERIRTWTDDRRCARIRCEALRVAGYWKSSTSTGLRIPSQIRIGRVVYWQANSASAAWRAELAGSRRCTVFEQHERLYVRTWRVRGGVTDDEVGARLRGVRHNYEIHSYGPPLNLAMYLNVALALQLRLREIWSAEPAGHRNGRPANDQREGLHLARKNLAWVTTSTRQNRQLTLKRC